MIQPINNMDEAQLTSEIRQLYKKLGYPEILQVLYEILKAGEIVANVIREEVLKEESH